MAAEALLQKEEILLAEECLAFALSNGAKQARITLNKSMMDGFGTLDGKTDKVSHCLDRSISLSLYVDGKYGTFSSNRFEEESLKSFVLKAIDTVRMLAEDEFRRLPDQARVEKNATTGLELGLYDPTYETITSEKRKEIALKAAGFLRPRPEGEGFKIISEEAEYSDSLFDTLVLDSNGTRCRHTETTFEYGVEVTILDPDGNKLTGYWWDTSTFFEDLDADSCFETAVQKASMKMNPKKHRSGKTNLVISTDCSSKVVVPVINALGAFSIQQNNSFMIDSKDKKIFSEGLTIIDSCRQKGLTGSRLFDSEGVMTKEVPVIENGVVKMYFVNTYMSGKMNTEPTVEDVIRPCIQKYLKPELGECPDKLDVDQIMKYCKEGILVTGFNGGNSNSSTGDFSYGIEGFAFKNGKITHPVKEMLITGNLITLWNSLLCCGNDSREHSTRRIPTLAFSDVDFSG